VEGDAINSLKLVFRPGGKVEGGSYWFSIGSAGSATLVLQTVLPPLLLAKSKSSRVLEGGTHNMMVPPFDFMKRSFIPQVEKTGVKFNVELESWGFYPAGGGRFNVQPRFLFKRAR